jgi:hypothetical protein
MDLQGQNDYSEPDSELRYDWRSVSHTVCLGVEPTLGLLTRYCFLFKGCGLEVAVLSTWGVLSDERSGLAFVSLSLQSFVCMYII